MQPVSEPTACRRRAYYTTKRVVDVVVASSLLLIAAPVLLIVVLVVKLDSPGAVVFRQERLRGRRIVDEDGHVRWKIEPFTLYKIRTMVAGADASPHQEYMTAYITGDEQWFTVRRDDRRPGDSYRPVRDPRLTRIGAVLRKLSLDELPQLWNVVKGDMSLVGPRPPMPYEAELYSKGELQRLHTPCGLTGWAQVKGRCTVCFDDMVRLDLEYLRRQSVWLDLQILVRTIPVVLLRKGAG